MIPDHVFLAIRENKVLVFEDGSIYDRDNTPGWIVLLVDEWILELRQLIVDSDWRVCANYQLHRQHFKRIRKGEMKGRMICEKCQQFRESIHSHESKENDHS